MSWYVQHNISNQDRVNIDPLAQLTVAARGDFRLILRSWRTDNCKNSDH